jgi:hypothetical protein
MDYRDTSLMRKHPSPGTTIGPQACEKTGVKSLDIFQAFTIMKSTHEHPRNSPGKPRDYVITMITKSCSHDQKFTKKI